MAISIGRFLRDIAGLLLGSFIAACVFLVMPALWGDLHKDGSVLSSLIPGTMIICFFSFPCGFAAHAALYAIKWRNLIAYCMAGACEAVIYSGFGNLKHFDLSDAQTMAQCAVASATCAAVAWFVRRPDKDNRPNKIPDNIF